MSLRPRIPPYAESAIRAFLQAHGRDEGSTGLVVGLSGGVDSALAARLAADALGPENLLAVLLPDAAHPPELEQETLEYADGLGVRHRVLAIDPIESALHGLLPEVVDRASWGNVKARVRMLLLYAIAREERKRVLGTGNKSELLLGYFTKYGDGGVDLLPLGDLYKTQVWDLAAQLDLPKEVRERAPTAGLWPGQTDEAELGLPYSQLDMILFGLEQLLSPEEIASRTGLPLDTVRGVETRVLAHRHKRRLPPIPKLSLRTVGLDWKE
ncbi:MAG TPA: NAD+ synthase [Thermoplasmata archaeon]|nr:NAD+ synthase [Thermoplasmata archaeon]